MHSTCTPIQAVRGGASCLLGLLLLYSHAEQAEAQTDPAPVYRCADEYTNVPSSADCTLLPQTQAARKFQARSDTRRTRPKPTKFSASQRIYGTRVYAGHGQYSASEPTRTTKKQRPHQAAHYAAKNTAKAAAWRSTLSPSAQPLPPPPLNLSAPAAVRPRAALPAPLGKQGLRP